jgi:hypothetical protein
VNSLLRRKFRCSGEKNPCRRQKNSLLCAAGNFLQVTGNAASTHSETADTAPNPKKFPAKFSASWEFEYEGR